MRVLVVTNMFPPSPDSYWGIFVKEQVCALREVRPDWTFDVLWIDGRANRLNYLWGIRDVWQRVRTQQYDVVHAHHGFAGFDACLQRNAPLVITYHGDDVWSTWHRWISRVAARVARCNVFVSEDMKLRMPCARSVVLPCGVDTNLFCLRDQTEARRELGLSFDERYVVFPGDPAVARKNYPLFNRVLSSLPVGLREKTNPLPLGGVPHDRIPLYFSAADATLLTSLDEGSPMVIKESMACNRPVVSVDVGDVAWLLDGLANCHVVASYESSLLADGLTDVLERGEPSNGRDRVFQLGLDSHSIAEQMIGIFEESRAAWDARGKRRDVPEQPHPIAASHE